MKRATIAILVLGLLTVLVAPRAGAAPLSTAYTYQGQLQQGGSPVNGTADVQFTLWDAVVGATQVGGPVAVNNVSVVNGLFSVQIDFGSNVFNGDARWLQIAVRSPAGGGAFTTLSPRQPVTAVPYALQTRGMFVDNTGNVGISTTNTSSLLTVGSPATRGTLNVVGSSIAVPVLSLTDSRPGGHQYSWYGGLNGLGSFDLFHQNSASSRFSVNSSGNVGIGTTAPTAKLHIANGDFVAGAPGEEFFFHPRSSFGGDFLHITDNDAGVPQFQHGLVIHQNGYVATRGEHLFHSTAGVNVGAINPDPPTGTSTFPGGTPTMSAGAISLYGPAGHTRFGVWSRFTLPGTWFPNQAELFMDAADGTRVVRIYTAGEGGAGGSSGNIVCTNLFVSGSKSFIVPNPDNPEQDITYACLEGPEISIYLRGTAKLNAGRAHVTLPTTFSSLASHEGLTVILTPLSGDSRGLACVNRTIHGFDVMELMNGAGGYEFDWEIKAIRRGTRDFKVLHPWTEYAGGTGSQSELWERRMADVERRNAKIAEEEAELGPRPGAGVASASEID